MRQFSPDDEVGLWIFSSDLGPGGRPWAEVSPVSPLGPKLARPRPGDPVAASDGGTALFASVHDAAARMGAAFDPARINGVVVLTDGRND